MLRSKNDGNQNVTLEVRGPHEDTFFKDLAAATGNPYNLTWKARNNETGACTTTLSTTYLHFTGGSSYDSICDNSGFRYTPEDQDEIAIDVRVIIPDGLTAQEYKNDTITFQANT